MDKETDLRETMNREEPPLSEGDSEMAREIANFIADRAFVFENAECRAWALTDFGTWAKLAGTEPTLALRERGRPEKRDVKDQ